MWSDWYSHDGDGSHSLSSSKSKGTQLKCEKTSSSSTATNAPRRILSQSIENVPVPVINEQAIGQNKEFYAVPSSSIQFPICNYTNIQFVPPIIHENQGTFMDLSTASLIQSSSQIGTRTLMKIRISSLDAQLGTGLRIFSFLQTVTFKSFHSHPGEPCKRTEFGL